MTEELKDNTELSPEEIETGQEYYKVTGPVGIYKRADGTYYGVITIEPSAEEIESQKCGWLKSILQRRISLISFIENKLAEKPNFILYWSYSKHVMRQNLLRHIGYETGTCSYDGVFYRLRLKTIDGRKQLHAEFSNMDTSLGFSEIDWSKVELSVALFHCENTVGDVIGFYPDPCKAKYV